MSTESHDNGTLLRVREVLIGNLVHMGCVADGDAPQVSDDLINALLNAGILFRERM